MDIYTALIGISALIGVLVGFIFGHFLLGPLLSFGKSSIRKTVRMITVLSSLALGVIILPALLDAPLRPFLENHFESQDVTVTYTENDQNAVPDVQVRQKIDDVLAGLNDPFFNAVIAKEPNRAATIIARLETAYLRGGVQEVEEEAKQLIVATGLGAMPHYLARAQSADLLSVIEAVRLTMIKLAIQDPETCHVWLYGQYSGHQVEYEKYKASIGLEQHMLLQTSLAAAVDGASEIIPVFDELIAAQIIHEANDLAYAQLGDQRIGLINTGQMPADVAEAKLACDTTIDMYEYIQASPQAIDVWRYFFATAQTS